MYVLPPSSESKQPKDTTKALVRSDKSNAIVESVQAIRDISVTDLRSSGSWSDPVVRDLYYNAQELVDQTHCGQKRSLEDGDVVRKPKRRKLDATVPAKSEVVEMDMEDPQVSAVCSLVGLLSEFHFSLKKVK